MPNYVLKTAATNFTPDTPSQDRPDPSQVYSSTRAAVSTGRGFGLRGCKIPCTRNHLPWIECVFRVGIGEQPSFPIHCGADSCLKRAMHSHHIKSHRHHTGLCLVTFEAPNSLLRHPLPAWQPMADCEWHAEEIPSKFVFIEH